MKREAVFKTHLEGSLIDGVRRRYRYLLVRDWRGDPDAPTQVMVLMNPSKADANRDDPTTTFCMNVAERDGFGRMLTLNLYAVVGTDPKILTEAKDPIGPHNDDYITRTLAKRRPGDRIVCAWGHAGADDGRRVDVCKMLRGHDLFCFGTVKGGWPRFPRALSKDVAVVPWRNPWA